MKERYTCLDCGKCDKREAFGPLTRCPDCNSWRVVDTTKWGSLHFEDKASYEHMRKILVA